MTVKSEKNMAVGVFDSGVGGLTVVKKLRTYLPSEDIIYFGDTARVPYGNKSAATIKKFSREIMEFLLNRGAKVIVVACNTASSLAVPSLAKECPVPMIGVITPGVKEAVSVSLNGRIGVIGTSSTISSRAYERALRKHDPSCSIFSRDCPLFVPLVENRFFSGPVTNMVAKGYLDWFKKKRIDTLILGCTHYPLLKTVIGEVMKGVRLIDSASGVAKTVKETLDKKCLASDRKGTGRIKCFVSDEPESFKKVAGIFLKEKFSITKALAG